MNAVAPSAPNQGERVVLREVKLYARKPSAEANAPMVVDTPLAPSPSTSTGSRNPRSYALIDACSGHIDENHRADPREATDELDV